MDYNEFVEAVKKEVEMRVQDCTTDIRECVKNNGLRLQGLIIIKANNSLSPTIYLNDFYSMYDSKKYSFERIIDKIIEIYEGSIMECDFEADFFRDFTKAKNNIAYRLVNFDKNAEILTEHPYIKYMDLAITFYYKMDQKYIDNATIFISNEHMENWGITKEELYEWCTINSPKLLKPDIQDIYDVIMDRIDKAIVQKISKAEDDIKGNMYVLTNDKMSYGAACILYPDILKEFSKKCGADFYIIPSSIHEVLLVPKKDDIDPYHLKELVKEVNKTEVLVTDVLSDNVYYYSRENDEITCLS